MSEVIKKSEELIEAGGNKYPAWEILRVGENLYRREIGIFAEIDGKKIPATELNDDWLRAGRQQEKSDRGDGEAKREL